jgi:rhodanese-related sulfurtransferase
LFRSSLVKVNFMTATITVSGLRNQPLANALLVDVRSASEFASGHVPGAINIPMDQIESRLADLDPSRPLVLVCQSDKRARMTASLLAPCRLQISVLEGGTKAWAQARLPLVTSVKTRWSLERQVRLGAGLLVLIGVTLALTVNPRWLFLSGFIGLGLSFSGITDICPMAILLAWMPWNSASHCQLPSSGEGLSQIQT